jgi:chromosome segregation ATPase
LERTERELKALKDSLTDRESGIERSNKHILDNMQKLSEIKANTSQLLKEEELLKDRSAALQVRIEELENAALGAEETGSNFEKEAGRLKKLIEEREKTQKDSDAKYNDKKTVIDRAVRRDQGSI